MAGSSITSPRKSGSIKRLTDIANPPNRPDSPEMPRGPISNPGPNRAVAPGSDTKPANISGIRNPGINRDYEYGQVAGSYKEPGSPESYWYPRSFEGKTIGAGINTNFQQPTQVITGQQLGPALNIQQRAAKRPQGSGMVSTGGIHGSVSHRAGDRTGVQVTGAGGTPIRVDNNKAIQGQATAQQSQYVQRRDKNSIYYDEAFDRAETDKENQAALSASPQYIDKQRNTLAMDRGFVTPGQKVIDGGTNLREGVVNVPKPMKDDREEKAAEAARREASKQVVYTISGRRFKVDPNDPTNMVDITDPNNPVQVAPDRAQNLYIYDIQGKGLQPEITYPEDSKTTGAQGGSEIATSQHGLSLMDVLDPVGAIASAVTGDENVQTMHTGVALGGPLGGIAASKATSHSIDDEDRLDDPNEISRRYPGLTVEDATTLLGMDYQFAADGGRVVTPSGREYTGSEITDFLKGDMRGYENAQEGVGDLMYIRGQAAKKKGEDDLANKQAIAAQSLEDLRSLMNQPVDTSAVTQQYDKVIESNRRAAARNKALSLRAIQERGAYSGASVNQMMGQSTEAGYGYDTQAQQQEAALGLQKAQAELQSALMQNQRKIDLAMLVYNNATLAADKKEAWLAMQAAQDQQNQYNAQMQAIQAEMNSPSLGMTLAKVGIGVGGAVLAPFTGGASLAASGALLGGMQAMGGGGGGAPMYMPYQYQSAPGSAPAATQSDFIYQTGYAPGQQPSGLNLGVPKLTLGAM